MRAFMKHLLFLIILVMAGAAHAAIDPAKVQKLLAGDGTNDNYFGYSVAISGDTAVIGAYGVDKSYLVKSVGAAYIFIRAADGTWSQQAKLIATDGADSDLFGISVAVSGDTAVIGADSDDDKGSFSGSAYVFIRAADGTWSQQAKLTADDGAVWDQFGWSVAVSGDTAVIGINGYEDKGGSAYVFVRAADGTWSQQAKLTADDGTADDRFGRSVAVSGDTAIIGAANDDDNGANSGSAYVFVRAANGTWSQQVKLTAKDGAAGDIFGRSVSMSGDTAVIGAIEDDNKGSAYVFVRATNGTWSQQAKLTAVNGSAHYGFGISVSVSGDTAVIGAASNDSFKGLAYVFTRVGETWSQQAKLTAADRADDDWFGYSVSVSGGTAVIGAYNDDDKGIDSGSAYVFGIPPVTHGINMAPVFKLLLR